MVHKYVLNLADLGVYVHASDVVIGNFYHLATELITLKVKHLTLRARRGFLFIIAIVIIYVK